MRAQINNCYRPYLPQFKGFTVDRLREMEG